MKKFAPSEMKKYEIRMRAWRLLFYGDDIFKKIGYLTGGERLRVTLACLSATNNYCSFLNLLGGSHDELF